MRRAGKVHPPFARRGFANVAVECVREHCSHGKLRGFNDKRNATRGNASRFGRDVRPGTQSFQQPQRWKS
jgi:hypothetical protein